MQKLIVLIIMTISSLAAFSQKDTHPKIINDSLICLPSRVLKEAVKDIIRLDSCTELLNDTEKELADVYEEVDLKDSVIESMKLKEIDYNNTINLERSKYTILDKHTKDVELNLTIAETKAKFWKYGFFTSIGIVLVTLFLHK